MANLRDLRQRISSVGNIQKITRAMEMVATTKLRRFQGKTLAAQPYTAEIDKLVRGLAGAALGGGAAAAELRALFEPVNPAAPHALLFIGSDRGLCGAYNSNLQRLVSEELARREGAKVFYVIGRKAMAYAARRGFEVAAYLEDCVIERIGFNDAAAISRLLVDAFRGGRAASVTLCFTRFRSMVKYEPVLAAFLPIAPPAGAAAAAREVILEPGAPELLSRLIPKFLETKVYHALLESVTSEYASRRVAMKNATDAAGEMKHEITRSYNKARQQKITSEILEIVSGAEAL